MGESGQSDWLLTNATVLTCAGGSGPLGGVDQGRIDLREMTCVAVSNGLVEGVARLDQLAKDRWADARRLDLDGCVIMPGLVDAHTHLVWSGERADEFERRIAGESYLDILSQGGGIISTVRATRAASHGDLIAQALARLDGLLQHGVTTAEVKTGYGLTTESELRLLDVIGDLEELHPINLVPTFLGAHAVPPEFAGKPDDYVDLVVDEQLPQAARRGLPGHGPPFCDVFCDEGAFTADQTRRILGRAAELGMPRKLHADEFGDLGAARLAAELRATSADHLVTTPAETLPLLRQAGTIAVLLPGTTFGLGSLHYADARALVEAGVAVALGTDLNPGTCWCESMPLIIALGVRYLGLSVSEAVVAATRNAAYACGRGDTAGRIEVGYPADLIVLDFRDYRHLAYRFGASPVRAVMIHGRWVWPSEDGPS